MSNDAVVDPGAADAATRKWLERAVLGLDLCPFARGPWDGGRVRIVVSPATTPEALAEALHDELKHLARADPARLETTLLVHPGVHADFLDFNDFLDVADSLLEALELEGVIQVASFHPDYRFADVPDEDPSHCTNRSPYPTLHLLRESSIERAVAAYGDTDAIFERNIETLRRIGAEGWRKRIGGER